MDVGELRLNRVNGYFVSRHKHQPLNSSHYYFNIIVIFSLFGLSSSVVFVRPEASVTVYGRFPRSQSVAHVCI